MAGKRRRGRRFLANAREFKQRGREEDAPCWLCGQPIDYDAPLNDPGEHTLDHIKPVDKFPELQDDPANWAHAHRRCNSSRKDKDPISECFHLAPWWKQNRV